MDGTNILSMIVENLHFWDSLNFLPMTLKSMPKSNDITCKTGFYPHFFNIAKNFNYVGPYPEPKFNEADYMSGDERAKILEWYVEQKYKIFCNKE